MGEIADMMLDGTMCCVCGCWLHDGADGDGFPQTCEGCADDNERDDDGRLTRLPPIRDYTPKPIRCAHCKKRVRTTQALLQHHHAKHSQLPPPEQENPGK